MCHRPTRVPRARRLAFALENLEPRRLLADIPLSAAQPAVFADADGDQVTVAVSGPGTGHVTQPGAGEFPDIVLGESTAQTALMVNVKKAPGGDGRTTLHGLAIDGALKLLKGPAVDVVQGDLTADWIGTLLLGNVEASTWQLGGTAASRPMALTLGSLVDVILTSGVPVKSLTAICWLDSDDGGDKLEAPSIGKVAMRGARAERIGGDLEADLTATSGSIGDVSAAGGHIVAQLTAAAGAVGKLSATSLYVWDSAEATGELVGGSLDVGIEAGQFNGQSVGTLTAAGPIEAVINAQGNVGGITATGKSFKSGMDDVGEWSERLVAMYDYYTADTHLEINVPATAAVGAIKVTGGDCEATITAGVIGAITVKGVMTNSLEGKSVFGGNLEANLTARIIVGLSTLGGGLTATLDAYESVGSISGRAIVQNAEGRWFSEEGERWFETVTEGYVYGDGVQVTLNLGIGQDAQPNNVNARLGSISGVGMDVVVEGQVPFPPENITPQITSKAIQYTADFEEDVDENDRLHIVRVSAQAGGNVDTSGLLQV